MQKHLKPVETKDFDQILHLDEELFSSEFQLSKEQLLSMHKIFAGGMFSLCDPGDKIIGFTLSMITDLIEDEDHSWVEETSNGRIESHNPKGSVFYLVKLAAKSKEDKKKLYQKNLSLTIDMQKKEFFAVVPLSGYHQFYDEMTAREYVQLVEYGKLEDEDVTPALESGLSVIRVIRDYFPGESRKSHSFAAYMNWKKE
jgi:hypothetical protein